MLVTIYTVQISSIVISMYKKLTDICIYDILGLPSITYFETIHCNCTEMVLVHTYDSICRTSSHSMNMSWILKHGRKEMILFPWLKAVVCQYCMVFDRKLHTGKLLSVEYSVKKSSFQEHLKMHQNYMLWLV